MGKQKRNDGILEYWNVGIFGKSSFRAFRSSHYSIAPLFHCSYPILPAERFLAIGHLFVFFEET